MSIHEDRTRIREIRNVELIDEPAQCSDCGDEIEDGTGCHCLEPYCAACFLQHCRDCARDMADDMRAELLMDRDR